MHLSEALRYIHTVNYNRDQTVQTCSEVRVQCITPRLIIKFAAILNVHRRSWIIRKTNVQHNFFWRLKTTFIHL